jgi:hypothetical protein
MKNLQEKMDEIPDMPKEEMEKMMSKMMEGHSPDMMMEMIVDTGRKLTRKS